MLCVCGGEGERGEGWAVHRLWAVGVELLKGRPREAAVGAVGLHLLHTVVGLPTTSALPPEISKLCSLEPGRQYSDHRTHEGVIAGLYTTTRLC